MKSHSSTHKKGIPRLTRNGIITKSQKETIELGKKLASKLKGGDIVLLYGELGTGKTVLAKGITQYFGIENITSPTFTLMNVYNIQTSKHSNIQTLAHIDTYRLKNEIDLIDIGVEDYLGERNTICLIEWPEKMLTLLENKKTMAITIEHLGKNERKLVIGDQ